jgi:RND superfamily putative drug exporter
VSSKSAPQDAATKNLVHAVRDEVHRDIRSGSGASAYVGGQTAVFIDLSDIINSHLPVFFGAVIGLSFLLLVVVFRSIVVPLKAALMNVLAIGASYGVLVAVFQWGWGASLIGAGRSGPIESFLPMFLFAILFGLSMDYEVFLVTRIHEEYLNSGNNSESVARGLAVTSRLITAAAAIMVAVFLSFAFGDSRIIKEFGLGLAAAVAVDATLIRLLLVPALMQLLGDVNWWFPSWLDRHVPRVHVEPIGEPVLVPVAE